jgi:hypothetical protein
LIPVGSSVVVAGGGLTWVELAIAMGNVDEGRVVNVEKMVGVERWAFVDDEVAVFESCAKDDLGRIMERKRRGEESVSDLEQWQDPLGRRRLGSMVTMMMMMMMLLLLMLLITTTIILSKQQSSWYEWGWTICCVRMLDRHNAGVYDMVWGYSKISRGRIIWSWASNADSQTLADSIDLYRSSKQR